MSSSENGYAMGKERGVPSLPCEATDLASILCVLQVFPDKISVCIYTRVIAQNMRKKCTMPLATRHHTP